MRSKENGLTPSLSKGEAPHICGPHGKRDGESKIH
jgi:hypothetical protein